MTVPSNFVIAQRLPPIVGLFGGIESTPGDGYKYHTFLETEPLLAIGGASEDCEWLCVAGGHCGGSGNTNNGGGGAGGFKCSDDLGNFTISSDTVMTVGVGSQPNGDGGSVPGHSSIGALVTSHRGGRPGYQDIGPSGSSGGSGGGACRFCGGVGGAGTAGEGYDGGSVSGSCGTGGTIHGCGGGGAGGVGGNGGGLAGNGGPGREWPVGSGDYYAGGGGGAHVTAPGVGGSGIGGTGGYGSSGFSLMGTGGAPCTGSGGGGGRTNSLPNPYETGGPGSQGIIIIRYLI